MIEQPTIPDGAGAHWVKARYDFGAMSEPIYGFIRRAEQKDPRTTKDAMLDALRDKVMLLRERLEGKDAFIEKLRTALQEAMKQADEAKAAADAARTARDEARDEVARLKQVVKKDDADARALKYAEDAVRRLREEAAERIAFLESENARLTEILDAGKFPADEPSLAA